ncbi:hypothetical protein SAMN05421833_102139 [Microbispora rosea]|uniref:Uncharacterized protein n=1 Tax=Microbispora rosea TaxID=58117 RepID=A0A1N6SWN2_9ACTN|nr:hypothetical protein [Microbispora rosea]GIH45286.1 hypothetical protein Mro03_04650 [Microbispora rosea subsp. rosea]SIQ45471.1 hypothetical protein SAMN05421833_102139 [Microbispora rosea]
MSGFTFELVPQKPAHRRERKRTFRLLAGTAGPYGEVSLRITTYPEEATLVAEGLPEASLSHPDAPSGYIPVDARTRLVVGGVTASLARNRRALRKEDRGIEIRLGGRSYTYLCGDTGREELWDSERGPVVRKGAPGANAGITMLVLPDADATDLSLALILQGADRLVLTVGGAIISGVMSFLNGSEGNA